jgi:hypothetical protein
MDMTKACKIAQSAVYSYRSTGGVTEESEFDNPAQAETSSVQQSMGTRALSPK